MFSTKAARHSAFRRDIWAFQMRLVGWNLRPSEFPKLVVGGGDVDRVSQRLGDFEFGPYVQFNAVAFGVKKYMPKAMP